MGSNRFSDSAIEQLVFFCVKVSVAAVKMDISCTGPFEPAALRSLLIASVLELAEGMALGSSVEVFKAGPLSAPGDGGGVGYASRPEDDLEFHILRKLSKPLTFGRSH